MTQIQLYREITGDHETHHRTIGAELAKAQPTQRRLIGLYAQGLTDRQVGHATNRTHGTARGILRRAMFAAYKRAHRMPRYHLVGRQHKPQAAAATVARIAAPTEPDTPHSFRDLLTPDERARL
jgi:hypothetical protein